MRESSRPATGLQTSVESLSQADVDVETHQVVAPDGSVAEEEVPDFTDEQFRDLYRWMLVQRTYDERGTKLQRRGRLGTFASGKGQEGAIIGSGYAAGGAGVSREKMVKTVLAWAGSLVLAFGVSYGAFLAVDAVL